LLDSLPITINSIFINRFKIIIIFGLYRIWKVILVHLFDWFFLWWIFVLFLKLCLLHWNKTILLHGFHGMCLCNRLQLRLEWCYFGLVRLFVSYHYRNYYELLFDGLIYLVWVCRWIYFLLGEYFLTFS
jgi:hypothetical protein